MVQVTIEVDVSKFANFKDKVPLIQEKGLDYASQGMIRPLMLNSPVDTGLLRQWFAEEHGTDEVHIRSPAKYARIVNDGYDGRIYPSGKALVFKPGKKHGNIPVQTKGKFKGFAVFASVKGQKGQHFVEKSIEETKGQLQGFFIKAVREVLQ